MLLSPRQSKKICFCIFNNFNNMINIELTSTMVLRKFKIHELLPTYYYYFLHFFVITSFGLMDTQILYSRVLRQ